jgi:hypothetical protein
VRFKIFLTADEPFPYTFVEEVRLLFASLVGINETRVTPVVQPKRSVEQSTDLELELQVAPPESQSEPTAEQAVQNFVEEQLGNFNSQLGGLPDAPANVTTRDVDGVPLETEILGEKPPPLPPTVPVAQPVATPTTTATPTPTTFSSSMTISVSIVTIVVSICMAI